MNDDGLISPDVGGWAEAKYRLLALYDELFSTGMKNKWDPRVHIDLYAGAGCSRIQGTSKFLKGSYGGNARRTTGRTPTGPVNTYICDLNTYWKWAGENKHLDYLKEEQKILATLNGPDILKVVNAKLSGTNLRRAHLVALTILDTGLRGLDKGS